MRFLGRRVYLGAVVLLVTVMRHGASPARLRKLREMYDIDLRTLERWRKWWQESFPQTPFWKIAKGRFDSPVDEALLPQSLLDRFLGSLRSRAISALEFISPITISSPILHAF